MLKLQYLKAANLCDTKAETSPSFICNFKSVVNILEETTVFEYNRENLPTPSFEAVFRHPRVKNPGNARTTIPGFSLAWKLKTADNLESESQVHFMTQLSFFKDTFSGASPKGRRLEPTKSITTLSATFPDKEH